MAIQPIDLQTLYTQLDKVGKTQVQQQAATQAARDAENANNKKEAVERMKTVQGTETSEEKAGRVHGRVENEERERDGGRSDKREGEEAEPRAETPETPPPEVIKDPALGAHIDISG